MGERAPQICTTIDRQTADTLALIKEEAGITEVELTRVLLKAACKHYKKFGRISLPIELTEAAAIDHKARRGS